MGFQRDWTENDDYDRKKYNQKKKPETVQDEGMREVRFDETAPTTSSRHNESPGDTGSMSDMPQRITHEGWHMGQEENKDRERVCDMQEDVHAKAQQEVSQDVQQEVSEQVGTNQCIQKVGIWAKEPNVPRVAEKVKNRVNRIKCLGNAVVPQLAEVFARAIKEGEK